MGLLQLHRLVKDTELLATLLRPCNLSALTFTHEHRNWITGEGNDAANACILAAHEKAFACVLEHVTIHVLKRYRTSVFLVFSLHTRTYTKCIWQLELSVRKTSETTAEWFYRGSYISFTMVARESGTISLWIVYSSNITVCEALALSEGEINIKTSRSFLAV